MDDLTPSNIVNAPVTRKSANKISKHLKEPDGDRFPEALGIAHRWRRQHALPTEECFRALLGATEAIGAPSLSFRLKRMESIIGKIKRPGKDYRLGTMDDIGGVPRYRRRYVAAREGRAGYPVVAKAQGRLRRDERLHEQATGERV